MIHEKLFFISNELMMNGILLCFKGPFSQGIIEELGGAIRAYISNSKKDEASAESTYFDVFSVYVEQTQNIKHYFEKHMEIENNKLIDYYAHSIVVIGIDDDNFYVSSGNVIENKDVPEFEQYLTHIKSMDKHEIKKSYKEQLRKKRDSEDIGAGLGLLEMAKKSSMPMEYNFIKLDDNISFFILKVII